MNTDRVVAAIDFGTHGTGYAWAVVDPRIRSKAQREINDKSDWPGANGPYSPKTLTALLLRDETVLAWGHPAAQTHSDLETAWHHEDRRAARSGRRSTTRQERERHAYYYGVKMSLRPQDDPARDVVGRSGGMADHLDDPTPVISAYLGEMVKVAVDEITRSGDYSTSDIRWCLTVPAIWDEWSMDSMRKAAVAAGLPADPARLLLIPEPDAAALYCDVVGTTTEEAHDGTPRSGLLRPGMRFLVVDCGGGTADLVSYQIELDGAIEQLCRPSGGPFGAEYTTWGRDGFLLKALASRFGSEVDFEELHLTHSDQFAKLAAQWEHSRNTFTVDQQRPLLVDFPPRLYRLLGEEALHRLAAAQPDGVDDAIILPAEEVRAILDSVIDPILDRVDEQLARWDPSPAPGRAGDAAFLVGGFARSPYLRRRLEDHLRDRMPLRTTPRPERAVLFGAVHYCYDPTLLRARRAKYTYGCEANMPFTEGDDPDQAFEDDTGARKSRKRFLRFVAADEKVPVDREVCERLIPSTKEQTSLQVDFYSTAEQDGRYSSDPGMKFVGKVEVSLAGAMHLPRLQRSVDIYMKFGEANIQVRAVNVTTGAAHETTLVFESVR
ncbi:Hsp70 family protein [Streptomyces sp. NPDC058252]|uniref:Hsp70 family protein n=1 Tax=Streptomyces sp. NPDC058252 TaxID=3346405 RepID=UPI0036EA1FB8